MGRPRRFALGSAAGAAGTGLSSGWVLRTASASIARSLSLLIGSGRTYGFGGVLIPHKLRSAILNLKAARLASCIHDESWLAVNDGASAETGRERIPNSDPLAPLISYLMVKSPS